MSYDIVGDELLRDVLEIEAAEQGNRWGHLATLMLEFNRVLRDTLEAPERDWENEGGR